MVWKLIHKERRQFCHTNSALKGGGWASISSAHILCTFRPRRRPTHLAHEWNMSKRKKPGAPTPSPPSPDHSPWTSCTTTNTLFLLVSSPTSPSNPPFLLRVSLTVPINHLEWFNSHRKTTLPTLTSLVSTHILPILFSPISDIADPSSALSGQKKASKKKTTMPITKAESTTVTVPKLPISSLPTSGLILTSSLGECLSPSQRRSPLTAPLSVHNSAPYHNAAPRSQRRSPFTMC